jgi:hypothetical protein
MTPTEHEEAVVRAFIAPARRPRWLEFLASDRRSAFLDRLNHCRDFDPRYAAPLAAGVSVASLLKARGAPATCYVLSAKWELDGREMPLVEALNAAEVGGWGTLISCIPGRLAYFYDECGERRLVLERPA